MPKRNYGFEKRQKEIAKRKKREERLARRRERNAPTDPSQADATEDSDSTDSPEIQP